MNPQISTASPEAPQVVGSLPPLEEFTEPVYNQVYQEQIVAGEMTQNITENSAVQEQVIVPEIPPVVERIQEQIVATNDVTQQRSQITFSTSSTSTSSSSTSTGSDELANMLELLTPMTAQIESIEKVTERVSMLTKRMMETPLSEPPTVEPPLPEPPMVEPDRTSAKRRRRTRNTPLTGTACTTRLTLRVATRLLTQCTEIADHTWDFQCTRHVRGEPVLSLSTLGRTTGSKCVAAYTTRLTSSV